MIASTSNTVRAAFSKLSNNKNRDAAVPRQGLGAQ